MKLTPDPKDLGTTLQEGHYDWQNNSIVSEFGVGVS